MLTFHEILDLLPPGTALWLLVSGGGLYLGLVALAAVVAALAPDPARREDARQLVRILPGHFLT